MCDFDSDRDGLVANGQGKNGQDLREDASVAGIGIGFLITMFLFVVVATKFFK
ncbi:MAG: hypothetical protein K0S38_903 [Candidatus Paceibacter sp.]|jgi:hypothetical protein|nr:hypothetical protein [Candidatus Paceibacter sp.]